MTSEIQPYISTNDCSQDIEPFETIHDEVVIDDNDSLPNESL